VEPLEGTEKLFSARWSPDEKQIVAMEAHTGKLFLRRSENGTWNSLTGHALGYPTWSRDGKYIYGDAGSFAAVHPVRIEVASGRMEEIARADFKPIGALGAGGWLGWTEDWEPVTVRDLSSTQVYRIDLDR
jgi:hypothetical protein